jgi:hypothetical protein
VKNDKKTFVVHEKSRRNFGSGGCFFNDPLPPGEFYDKQGAVEERNAKRKASWGFFRCRGKAFCYGRVFKDYIICVSGFIAEMWGTQWETMVIDQQSQFNFCYETKRIFSLSLHVFIVKYFFSDWLHVSAF